MLEGFRIIGKIERVEIIAVGRSSSYSAIFELSNSVTGAGEN
jgi:hypothetical protein